MGRGHVSGSDWTEAQIAAVAAMWAEGLSAGQIAARLGSQPKRTRNAILGMMNRHRERFPKKTPPGRKPGGARKGAGNSRSWSSAEIETAQRMWAARMPTPEIAQAIGRTAYAVQSYANSHPELFAERDPVKRQVSTARAAPAAKAVFDLAERFPPPPEAPDMRPVTLMERRANQCAFPLWEHYGDKPTAESLYCGGAVAVTEAGCGHYCAYHRALVYRPFTEKPHKDQPQHRADQPRRRAA